MNKKSNKQKEILDSIGTNPHGLLVLSPRIGKTKLGIDIIKRDKPKKILWVTVSSKLRDVDIPEEFITWKAKTHLRNTTIICYNSLKTIKGKYDLVILDEYQMLTLNYAKPLLKKVIKYKTIIGLTGTQSKDIKKKEILEKLRLTPLFTLSIDDAVEAGLIAPYTITVKFLPLDKTTKNILAGGKNKKWFNTELEQYNYLSTVIAKSRGKSTAFANFNRMRFLGSTPTKIRLAKKIVSEGRTLSFSITKKVADQISPYVFYSGSGNNNLEKFSDNKVPTLSCVNMGGVGFTFRGTDKFLITQVDSDTNGSTTQRISRALVEQGPDYEGNIIILCHKGTVDESWLNKSLESFNPKNIVYEEINN